MIKLTNRLYGTDDSQFRFCHADLHGGNFLVRSDKRPIEELLKINTKLFDFDLSVLGFKKEDIPPRTRPSESITSLPEFREGFFNELGERIFSESLSHKFI